MYATSSGSVANLYYALHIVTVQGQGAASTGSRAKGLEFEDPMSCRRHDAFHPGLETDGNLLCDHVDDGDAVRGIRRSTAPWRLQDGSGSPIFARGKKTSSPFAPWRTWSAVGEVRRHPGDLGGKVSGCLIFWHRLGPRDRGRNALTLRLLPGAVCFLYGL